MTTYLASSPVSAGLYLVLNVAALTALATGGVGDDIAQSTGFPFVLFTVEPEEADGFGSTSGTAGLVIKVDLLVQVFSQYEGMHEAQGVMAKVMELLKTPPAVTGFSSWAIFRQGKSIAIGDSIVSGVKVKELAQHFDLWVELQ